MVIMLNGWNLLGTNKVALMFLADMCIISVITLMERSNSTQSKYHESIALSVNEFLLECVLLGWSRSG